MIIWLPICYFMYIYKHIYKSWHTFFFYPQSSLLYELFSVMVHSGSAAGGHYYACIRSFSDDQWYSFNDQHVSKVKILFLVILCTHRWTNKFVFCMWFFTYIYWSWFYVQVFQAFTLFHLLILMSCHIHMFHSWG